MRNDYHFITHWHVAGRIGRVYDLIADPVEYPRWWSSVYLETSELARGNERGVGRPFRLYTKGFLPYTLRWESCAIEADRPHRLRSGLPVISMAGVFGHYAGMALLWMWTLTGN